MTLDNQPEKDPTPVPQKEPAQEERPPTLVEAKREASKWTDVAGVIINIAIAVGAFVSAWIIQGQLTEARIGTRLASESFRTDERAWVEIEPIKPRLRSVDKNLSAFFTCDIFPKNVGKTVARDISVKAQGFELNEGAWQNPDIARSIQDKVLFGKVQPTGTNQPFVYPDNPVPKVLAPNSVSPAPFSLNCPAPHLVDGNLHKEYMAGRIDYRDQFQVKHWLKFCFLVVNPEGQVWPCPEGNEEDSNSESPTPETTCAKPDQSAIQ